MRAVANIETISSDAIEYPRDDDEAAAGWVGEQEDRTETGTPKVGMQRIPVHELYANPKVTQKLLEDNAWNVEAWLGNKIGDKFGRVEANAFVAGHGVKKPRGLHDEILPLVTGQDWTSLTAKLPPWSIPLAW
jgi:HK97 family phage major capsid protein